MYKRINDQIIAQSPKLNLNIYNNIILQQNIVR